MNSTVKSSGRFLKSRGLQASVPFLSPPPPALLIFALALIYAWPECEKALPTGKLATQANWSMTCHSRAWRSSHIHIQHDG